MLCAVSHLRLLAFIIVALIVAFIIVLLLHIIYGKLSVIVLNSDYRFTVF